MGDDPIGALLTALQADFQRVVDVFRIMDEDMSGSLDKAEFRRGCQYFLRRSGAEPPPYEVIDLLFKRIDADGSGTLELRELDKCLRSGQRQAAQLDEALLDGAAGEIVLSSKNKTALRSREQLGAKALMKVTLDVSASTPEEALRHALNENAVRVIDLFRDCARPAHDTPYDTHSQAGPLSLLTPLPLWATAYARATAHNRARPQPSQYAIPVVWPLTVLGRRPPRPRVRRDRGRERRRRGVA